MSQSTTTRKPYIEPQDVIAPQQEMRLIDVLIDGGEERSPSYGLQFWIKNNEYSIGFRWNGDAEKRIGTPNISGNACWIVLDKMLWPAVLSAMIDINKRDQAAKLLYGSL